MTARLADTPVLTTSRLTLRAPEASDFEAFAPFVMSDRARFIGGGADKDIGQAWRVLAVLSGHWHLRGYGTFVMVETASGRPIGSAGPWFPGDWPEEELGWTIWTPEAEGKGYAFEAVTELRRHAYAGLGWSTAVSYIDARNERSLALARRLGCIIDPSAARPDRDAPIEVWRHPSPAEVLAA
ncbi:GNAT family N-acetyltransferase [Roseibacterium sp. SDUM158016]|uniref:GNAT family N-acetyltransferase n=1 Tax=Roseicyclus sediminis TaxID=2980997 RepID=UPI0021D3D045|nr:GNAT family N-acetyltransferase [Roseibacterium sp. SDUM158016]MCU4651296.1 GNAT family N-acetyltransferase [Roseibacterium sp. SDUM158016]